MLTFAFFLHLQRLLDSLADLDGHHTPHVQQEYVRVFMHDTERAPCLPYESAYVDPEGRDAGRVVAQVEGEYAAAGLALSPSFKELPDHVAVELEFMGFLCGQEAGAWEVEDGEEATKALGRQADFLDRHLLRWFPGWAGQVMLTDCSEFYPIVAKAAQAFVRHDRDLISLLLERFRGVLEVAQLGDA